MEKDNSTCFPKQESGSEIRSNQQLPASCGFIKSKKIAIIVAHRAKLSHQKVFWGNYFKNSQCRPVELDVCCVVWASLQKGKRPSLQVCSCESPTTKRPPPYYPVGSDASAGTQVWSCYYASLPSARNTMIKLKVSDSCCAPFSRFNYVQLLSAWAPRCCSSCVGYCSSVKRLFFNLSVNHTRLMMAK